MTIENCEALMKNYRVREKRLYDAVSKGKIKTVPEEFYRRACEYFFLANQLQKYNSIPEAKKAFEESWVAMHRAADSFSKSLESLDLLEFER
mgnify:CR=1 FL=1